jgi:hypothetical protein
MRSIWIYLVCGAALVSASAAYAVLTTSDKPSSSTASAANRRKARVKIAGYVEYLYPGGHVRLQLSLRNRSPERVTVRWVKARVGDAGPGCSAAKLTIPKRGHLRLKIPPNRRRGVAMTATLAASAPAACQNATFPLRYKAKAKP